jgi:hypothetical protein
VAAVVAGLIVAAVSTVAAAEVVAAAEIVAVAAIFVSASWKGWIRTGTAFLSRTKSLIGRAAWSSEWPAMPGSIHPDRFR